MSSVTFHRYTASLLGDYCFGSGEYKCDSSASGEFISGATLLLITHYSGAAAVHGGYLASVILWTVSEHFQRTLRHLNQPDTLTLHLEYLRSATFGNADLAIKDVMEGSQMSTVQISLSQGGKEKVVGYAT